MGMGPWEHEEAPGMAPQVLKPSVAVKPMGTWQQVMVLGSQSSKVVGN
jgi:hypothetical protein